ncbi:MAG: 2Fe-2S iron-sulfur cluster-binding protein [Terriglobales bacterium]
MSQEDVPVYDVTLILPDGSERTLSVRGDQHIWDAAYYAGIHLPALCHQGWCCTCAARLESVGCVDQSDSVSYFPQDREAGYVLLCTGKPCGNMRIRTGQARAMRQHRLKLGLPAPYAKL